MNVSIYFIYLDSLLLEMCVKQVFKGTNYYFITVINLKISGLKECLESVISPLISALVFSIAI